MVKTAKESQRTGCKDPDKLNEKDSDENRKLSKKLSAILDTVGEIIKQAEEVQPGNTHIKDRIVSIHDKEARPSKKGKLRAKVEFGYKAQIEECEKGFVSNYEVYKGNPADIQPMDAVERHEKTFGHVPETVTDDRGYGGTCTWVSWGILTHNLLNAVKYA
jgi:hypothetical protein